MIHAHSAATRSSATITACAASTRMGTSDER
jgi:hypothetical protein